MNEAMTSLLFANKLTKIFFKGAGLLKIKIVAVNNVSFKIESIKPEIFVLAGESGSGKSTIANMILNFESPTEGKISYKGKDIAKISSNREKKKFMVEVQPVFQNPFDTFNPLKTVDTYLFETKANFMDNVSDKSSQDLKRALEIVGLSLEQIQGKYPSELSGGQMQRVSIARALITKPVLLIADEPVSMIDTSLRMSIVNLFKELKEKEGLYIIYITHDLATAYYIGDRIGIMLRGEIVEMGSVEEVLGNPLHPYTRLLKESIPNPNPKKRWKEEINLSNLEAKEYSLQGCKFIGRCLYSKEICQREQPKEVITDSRIIKCHLY